MSRKKFQILIPLGALLLSLVLLAGCRPSDALTRLMNAMNALNPSNEEMTTEEEEENNEPSDQMDPIDEERDDAMIEETEELIGQMLESMDPETAQEALQSVYSASAESGEWGAQEYNPDRLTYGNPDGALVLNVKGNETRGDSTVSASGEGNGTGTGSITADGMESSSGVDSEGAGISEDPDMGGGGTGGGEGGTVPQSGSSGANAGDGTGDGTGSGSGDGTGSGSGSGSGDGTGSGSGDGTGDENKKTASDHGYRIAAVGEAAVMVCMLGGSDRLVAVSPDFAENGLAMRAFGEGRTVLWTEFEDGTSAYDTGRLDGSKPMSETEFATLLEVADVVVVPNGYNAISESQYERMTDAGVSYYSLDPMVTTDRSEYTVTLAQSNTITALYNLADMMLKDDPGGRYGTVADAYGGTEGFVNTILLDDFANVNLSVVETVFIEDWDDNAETVQTSADTGVTETLDTGTAVIKIGSSFRSLSASLINANVYDWSASPHTRGYPLESTYGFGKETNNNGIEIWAEHSEAEDYETVVGDLCYITPIYNDLDTRKDNKGGLSFAGGYGYEEIDCIRYYTEGGTKRAVNSGGVSFGCICLGYNDQWSRWDTVIAKNQTVASKLNENKSRGGAWSVNGSSGTIYGKPVSVSLGDVQYLCTPLTLNNVSCNTSIGGDYSVVVNPSGLGDWLFGPECILETVWAACVLQENSTTHNGVAYGYMTGKIQEFYETFYGLSLSTQEIEDQILAGDAA